MTGKPPQKTKAAESREDRLKAALKANLARRKKQAKARDNKSGQKERDDG